MKGLQRVPAWLCALCAGLMAILLGLVVIGQPWLNSYYAPKSLLANAWLYPIALAGIAALFYTSRHDPAAPKERCWVVPVLFLLTLGAQFIVARTCWYKMGWDVHNVYTTGEDIAMGREWYQPEYFQLCPNNAPLTLLVAVPLWVAAKIGLGVPFVVLPYIDAVLLNLASYVAYRCAEHLTQSRTARAFALTMSIGWIALSPFILYPYTDTFSILFPVLALLVWLKVRRGWLKWLLVSLLCFFGASIKPTVLIVFLAMIIVDLCRSKWSLKRGAAIALAVVIGMLPGKIFQDQATLYLTGSTVPEGQLSMTHYLMLGMNGKTHGGHSTEDVQFSQSFETLAERQSANLERAWERLTERSFGENLQFFAVKAYKAYADGSFAVHSSFLELEIPHREGFVSDTLRSFYHPGGDMAKYPLTLVQCLWLGVLTLCAIAAWRSRQNPAIALLCVTLLGLTAYLLLFEVWPRYLFLYAPFFVILASMAFHKKGVR